MTSDSVHYLAVEGGPTDGDREGPLQGTGNTVLLGAVLIGPVLLGPVLLGTHCHNFTACSELTVNCHNSTAYCPLCTVSTAQCSMKTLQHDC